MQKRATVKDIAKHAGVSPATVSLVLRNSPLVARPTRERVQSSIGSLGYVYDRAAANLRARLTQTIGLIVCEITNPFYAELTAGIDERARSRRLGRLSRQHRGIAGAPGPLHRAHARASRRRAAAEPGRGHRSGDHRAAASPAACRWCRCCAASAGASADHVGADFRLGMTLAAEHLIRLGHKRIAFVGGGRRASPARDRALAYRETLTRHGLPIGPIVNCLPTREEGDAGRRPLLTRQARAIRRRSSATTTSAPSACWSGSPTAGWSPAATAP